MHNFVMRDTQNHHRFFLFLLYVSVMLVITYLQQEFVLLPSLQNLDLVSEESRLLLLQKWNKWRWIAFLAGPALLLLRLFLVTLCLFVGSFFFSEMSGRKFKDWWSIAMKAQAVLILYSVILCIVNIYVGSEQSMSLLKYTSLLFLAPDTIEQWIKLPLSAVNLFEIIYWSVMAFIVCRLTESTFRKSFKFVMSSYGVGYLFYIVLLMFLMLYLS